MRCHSTTISTVANATSRSNHGKSYHTAASASGARITADTARTARSRNRPGRAASDADGAIATLAPTELGNGVLKIGLAEVGPQGAAEHQLSIGRLPQQKIADALIAAGADQQVRFGQLVRPQVTLQHLLVDRLGPQL